MNAFEVGYWLKVLGDDHYPNILDEASIAAVKELFRITARIQAVGDDDRKEFWVSAKRGTLEEFKEYYYDEADEEELKEAYEDYYPDETVWYKFVSVHHQFSGPEEEFFAVFLGHEYVLAVNDCNSKGYPIDATEFINWLCEAVEEVIRQVEQGIYNDMIAESLPHKYRYGTINRKDYWDIYPEERKKYRSCFKEDEINEFMLTARPEPYATYEDIDLMSTLTARQFYEACATGYKALGLEPRSCFRYKETEEERARYNGETTPKEYYYMYADGRDDGMINVPLDDPQDFSEWLDHKGPYRKSNGGHPWEIIPSMSISNSLHLNVWKSRSDKNKGYYFSLSGAKLVRSPDTVVFYLALRRVGYPVYLWDCDILKARFSESDKIGILPQAIRSIYGSSAFGREVEDCVNLDDGNNPEAVVAAADWIAEKEVSLKENMCKR